MSKISKIRWRESDHLEIRKAVKNFNAKIRRLEKKNPEIKNLLPSRVSVKDIYEGREVMDSDGSMIRKGGIYSRNDLKRELNMLKKFTERGSEEIVKVPGSDYNLYTTKWQKERMVYQTREINRARKRRLKELQETPVKSRGKEVGYTLAEGVGMGSADIVSLEPMKPFSKKMTRHDLERKFTNIMIESKSTYWHERDLALQENYIKALKRTYGENNEKLKPLIDHIEHMNFDEFRQKLFEEDYRFEMAYHPAGRSEKTEYLEQLQSIWMPNKQTKSKKK